MPYLGLVPESATLIPLIERIEADATALAARLSPAQLNWRPRDGGWSVAQTLTHVTLGNRIYFPTLRRVLAEAGPPTGPTKTAWRPSLFGRLMIRSLVPTNTRKLPTSGKLKPGPEPGVDALAAFIASYHEVQAITKAAEGHDLNRLKLTSPVSPLVRGLNFGDALIILVVHGQRHLRQVERVKSSPGFPAA